MPGTYFGLGPVLRRHKSPRKFLTFRRHEVVAEDWVVGCATVLECGGRSLLSKRRKFSAELKAKVSFETLAELAGKYDSHPTMIAGGASQGGEGGMLILESGYRVKGF